MEKSAMVTERREVRSIGGDERLIPLEDDCMFSAVMRNKDACIGLVEALFGGRRVRDIEYVDPPETQRFVSVLPDGKSIRLDVYFEDSDAVYDIEVQRMNQGGLRRRARLYSSYMDAGMLARGVDYEGLRRSYVVFICKFDPLGFGRKMYSFKMFCEEDKDLPLDDGRNIIFVNTKGSVGGVSSELDALASYINGGVTSIGRKTGSPYVDRLDCYVRELNMDEGWRMEHMKYELNLLDKYREGEKAGFSQGEAAGLSKGETIGLSKGRCEGVAEEKRRIAREMHAKGISNDVIASCTSLGINEVERIIKG